MYIVIQKRFTALSVMHHHHVLHHVVVPVMVPMIAVVVLVVLAQDLGDEPCNQHRTEIRTSSSVLTSSSSEKPSPSVSVVGLCLHGQQQQRHKSSAEGEELGSSEDHCSADERKNS
ncbi:hypothetical protein TNIN_80961 [Trichonephila inaurata madagascariensis]|uniref:Uncharacterized protein n=1 Tax=Trichonephila inaurata madagascariensis TaxID=2747483 RepID=A0A8X6X7R3_9ARAC|nr:hypothetical protein TNIN_80961 [Trichonephila inaurata madagascariensis]